MLNQSVRCSVVIVLASFFGWCAYAVQTQESTTYKTLSFESKDGLKVTADLYSPHEDAATPFIVLCHQAGWSRGEYREIAPKLNKMGFNCLAIDQRSGGKINDVVNETAKAAKKKRLATEYVDAQQDIVAALNFVKKDKATGQVILWGSSYSAALALVISGENPELVDGVLSFAPGEYFARSGKSKTWVAQSAASIADPVFITSAKNEAKNWKAIFDAIEVDTKQKFLPKTKGKHGSSALWEKSGDHDAYWESVSGFLKQFVTADSNAESDAGEVVYGDKFPKVMAVKAAKVKGNQWRFNVTLSSEYDTPKRYADAWRVLDENDNQLGIRILGHDHAGEQPFTRSQTIEVPEGITALSVEGRDKSNGWSGQRFKFKLTE